MKYFILIFIFLSTFFINYIYSQESDDFVRRKIMLLPFINKSTDTKYDYLSDVIRHSLKTELNNKDIYNFAGFNEIDENTKDIRYVNGEISSENQLLNIAIKMSTDVVVLGSYDIKEEKITININAIDILTGQKVIEIKKEGELGVDLLILVDEVAKLMSEEMYKELTMVRKSYYEMKLKEQEEKLLQPEKIKNKLDDIWTRHFLNICFIDGATLFLDQKYTYIDEYYVEHHTGTNGSFLATVNAYGGLLGFSIGYLYSFTKYFGFGPELNIFGSILYAEVEVDYKDSELEDKYKSTFYYENFSIALMFQFMIGDLINKRIAFLIDIGGGWIGSIKIGIYVKGFVLKTGYSITGCITPIEKEYLDFHSNDQFKVFHNITIDIGYTINFKYKKLKK